MSYEQRDPLSAPLKRFGRDERRDLVRKIASIHDELHALNEEFGAVPGAQEKLRNVVGKLGAHTAVLSEIATAVDDELTSFSCAMNGFLDMLNKLGEHELCSVHLLTILSPLEKQFGRAFGVLNDAVIG